METISLKMDDSLLKNIDSTIKKHNFSTRTEFIRTAIRDELEKLKRDKLIEEFLNMRGKATKTHSDKEWREIKDKAYIQFIKEQGWD